MPVLIGCARSPFAAANGVLGTWHPVDLSAAVLEAAVERAGIAGDDIGGLWVGCAEPVGAQGANLARAVALAAGLPDGVGGVVLDRAETSGSAALCAAADALRCGRVETAAVLGVCLASTVAPGANATGRTYGTPWGDAPAQRVRERGGLLSNPLAAEAAAAAAGIGREELRRWALRSFERRGAAEQASPAERALGSIVEVEARPSDGVPVRRRTVIDADVVRRLPADLSELRPMFAADGLLDAVSFAPPADGVTALVLRRSGSGIAELVHCTLVAGDPLDPAGGLVPAHLGAAGQAAAKSSVADASAAGQAAAGRAAAEAFAAIEIAEPSAAGALLVCRALSIEPSAAERLVNTRGGTLAVGDVGAAEELRLCADRLADLRPGELLAAVAAGTGGAAVSVWRRQ